MVIIVKLKCFANDIDTLRIAMQLKEMEQLTGIIVLDDRFEFPPVKTNDEKIKVAGKDAYMSDKFKDFRKRIVEDTKKERIHFVESVFGIKLFDWQKEFIFENIPFDRAIGFARRAGKTFARCVKICFSKGEPLYIYKHQYYPLEGSVIATAAEDAGTQQRLDLFIDELRKVYTKLSEAGTPGLREIHFGKKGGV